MTAHRRAHLALPDGRRLAWSEYGPADGRPVLYLHGGNDCGLEGGWFADSLAGDVRLIAPDRPGFGESTFLAGRVLSDMVEDTDRLLDALGLDRVPAFGLSGGGPHVLALATLGARIERVAVVAGPCPLDRSPGRHLRGAWLPIRFAYFMARHAPEWALRWLQRAMNDAERNMRYAARMPAPDAELFLEEPTRKLRVIESVTLAHAQGYAGAVQEWRLYVRPWGFSPADLRLPTTLWYGDADGMAPPSMGERLAELIPGSRLHVLAGEAHLSLIHRHARRVVDDLLGEGGGRSAAGAADP